MPVIVTKLVEFDRDVYEFIGTEDGDIIKGFSKQINRIYGQDGDDILAVGRQIDFPGLAGTQTLFGEAGDDTLKGGLTSDYLDGGEGADLMMGGPGHDYYRVDSPFDVIVEKERWLPESGAENSVTAFIDFSLEGLAVKDLLIQGDATVGTGNKFSNNIVGSNLLGVTLDGGLGIDTLKGRGGDDTYVLRHKLDVAIEPGLTVREKTLKAELFGHDTVIAHNSYRLAFGIEDILLQDVTGKTGDLVNGFTAIGNNLDNLVQGNATDNNLNGRTGNDTLTGGDGADSFIFTDTLGAQHADTITDFSTGEDRVVIKGGLVNVDPGALDVDHFHLGSEALTADHRFLFDGSTLRYDADGSGAGEAVDVAYSEGAVSLAAEDIFVI